MTLARKLMIGAAALAAVGIAGVVAAANLHTLRVALPGGGTETITYVGDTPPKVSIAAGPWARIAFAPLAEGPADPVFAQMDRVAAEMDARADAMMRAAAAMPTSGAPLSRVNLAALPAGASGYTVVSTFSGGKSCVRTTRYTSGDNGAPAKILTSASEGCDAAPNRPAPAPVATPAAPRQTPMTKVRWDGAKAPGEIAD